MARYRTREVVRNDRFSELPRNLVETILDLLPLRDAVRTSILSRKSRHFWTIIPHLKFDHDFFMSIRPKLNCYEDPELKTLEFLCVIDKILRLHNGPLLKFTLKFLEDCDLQMMSDQINQWIPLLSRKCVKQLTLQTSHIRGILYDFNPNIFSCLELTNLRVEFAQLPKFGAFTFLTTNLELVHCHCSVIAESIFQCPLLETLTLKYCFDDICHANFHAPNLKCLRLDSSRICLEGLKTLTEFSFCMKPWLRSFQTCNVARVLGYLNKVEKLTFGSWSLQHLATAGSPNRRPQPLPYLKDLIISHVTFTDMLVVSSVFYIIQSAPYLCKLEISGMLACFGEPDENYQVQDTDGFSFGHLEYVRFSDFEGYSTELELIKFIVGHSPLLKKMFIHCSKADAVAQKMSKFSFASPVAQICFV